MTDADLARFFFAMVSLLFFAHFFGYLFDRLGLPRVIGEITGGLFLGKSFLGVIAPNIHQWIFLGFDGEQKLISAFYTFGLVLLMFISGFEMDKSFAKEDRKIVIAVLLGSTLFPFAVGWLAPVYFDLARFMGSQQNPFSFRLVIAIAAAVTSIPVISRIFIDLKIMDTRFARIVLSSATLHDILLWVALAVATGMIGSADVSKSKIVSTVLATILLFVIVLKVMPRILLAINNLRFNFFLKSSSHGYVLSICFLFAAIASLMNVNIVFGALLAGLIIGLMPGENFVAAKKEVKAVALGFFIPLYFAVVGYKIDLIHHFNPQLFVGFLVLTSLVQLLSTSLVSRWASNNWLSSFNLAMAMNTRGGPGIVLASIAFDYGIIDETFFVVLVLTAIATSLTSGLWFRLILNRGLPLMQA